MMLVITLVAVMSLFGCIYCIGKIVDFRAEIASVNKKTVNAKLTIDRYRELDKSFGVGSKTFYASKPIIFLKAGGDSEAITVYRDKADNKIFAKPSSTDIVGEWSKWKNTSKNYSVDYTIKPSDHAGYYTVHFEDKLNGAAFDVLIVVQ